MPPEVDNVQNLGEDDLQQTAAQFRQLVDWAPVSIAMFDRDMRYVELSQGWRDDCQIGSRNVVGLTHYELFPDLPERWKEVHKRCLAGATERCEADLFLRPDGTTAWIRWEVKPWREESGNIGGIVMWTEDITDRKRIEEELKESEQQFRGVFESAGHGMVLVSVEGKFLEVNSALCAILGYSEAELLASDFQNITHPDDLAKDVDHLYQLRANQIQSYHVEKRYLHKNGNIVWASLSVSIVRSSSGTIRNFVSHIHDVTESKRSSELIRSMAFHDSLTGLPNRSLLNDRLEQAMTATKRSGCYGALMFIDLDNFKSLNDTYGHEVGDRLLIEASRRLTQCVRESDTVSRFGGDEFVVMLSELNADKAISISQTKVVAEKISSALSEPYHLTTKNKDSGDDQIEHFCTASIGVVTFIDSQVTQTEILMWADKAMYDAKNGGRNAIRFAPEAAVQARE